MKKIIVPPTATGLTLQRGLTKWYPDVPKTLLLKLIRKRKVRLNGQVATAGTVKIKAGDIVEVWEPQEIQIGVKKVATSHETARAIPWSILYEDDDLIVIDKPAGVAVQSGQVGSRSVIDAMLQAYPSKDPFGQPALVHRLDKGTSGVLVVAKRRDIAHELAEQFQRREIKKEYWAVVQGVPSWDEKTLTNIFEFQGGHVIVHPADQKVPGGAVAETRVLVKKRGAKTSLLQLFPLTGRKHQLRAQLAKAGFPIVGDDRYGRKRGASRLMLHAHRLSFVHPRTKKKMQLEAGLPAEFERLS